MVIKQVLRIENRKYYHYHLSFFIKTLIQEAMQRKQIKIIMRSKSVKRSLEGNQYLETPRINRQNLREKERFSEDIRGKYVQQLQERNRKLKYEILKINEMLDEHREQKQTEKKEHKLIPNQTSTEVLQKQLQNAYKQIKNYEKEINMLENKQAGGMISIKMSRLQNILKQKSIHLDKLKGEHSALMKSSVDNTKKLKDNAGKEELENQMLKYNQQIKFLREKVREAENRQKKKAQNAKKQFDYIKKLERELIENGIAIDEIQDVKRNNIFNQIYEKMNNPDKEDYGNSRVDQNSPLQKKKIENKNEKIEREIPVEQMTLDKYNEMRNQIKLFKKLQGDYDKRLSNIEKEKKIQEKQTDTAKQVLKEKDEQIKRIQQQIGQLREKVKKPVRKLPQGTEKFGDRSKQKAKITPSKSIQERQVSVKKVSDQTRIKYDEKGQKTDKSKKFTDRNILGKQTDIKIIGVKVWTDKGNYRINGIQCIYKVKDNIKYGQEHMSREGKNHCTQNILDVEEGDYIKSITVHLSESNIVEYIVFISKKAKAGRFGQANQTQKQFNYQIDEDEIPINMYGSICYTKEGNKEGSYLESLGFEITNDKTLNKHDPYS